MARSEARIYTDIWEDADFLSLRPGAQRAYMFLLSQNDLAHDGVIALRVSRWARKSHDLHPNQLREDLAELEAGGFVVVDDDEEELLIRSFIRRDKVYRQPNVLRAAADHLPLVSSRTVRATLYAEIERILTFDHLHKDAKPILDEMLQDLKPKAVPAGENPRRNPSANPSGRGPGERGVVTVRTTDSPVPRSSNPRSPAPGGGLVGDPRPHARAREEPPADAGPPGAAEEVLAEWIGRLKKPPQKRIVNAIGVIVQAALGEGQDDADVREALKRWQAKGNLGPAVLPSIIHEVANGPRPGTDVAPARAGPNSTPRSSVTEERARQAKAAGAAVQAKLDQMMGAAP